MNPFLRSLSIHTHQGLSVFKGTCVEKASGRHLDTFEGANTIVKYNPAHTQVTEQARTILMCARENRTNRNTTQRSTDSKSTYPLHMKKVILTTTTQYNRGDKSLPSKCASPHKLHPQALTIPSCVPTVSTCARPHPTIVGEGRALEGSHSHPEV